MLIYGELTLSELITKTIGVHVVLVLIYLFHYLISTLEVIKLLRDLLRTKEGEAEVRSREPSYYI